MHHEFHPLPPPPPEQCQCDPLHWGDEDVPEPCNDFAAMAGGNIWEIRCVNCNHERECHDDGGPYAPEGDFGEEDQDG